MPSLFSQQESTGSESEFDDVPTTQSTEAKVAEDENPF